MSALRLALLLAAVIAAGPLQATAAPAAARGPAGAAARPAGVAARPAGAAARPAGAAALAAAEQRAARRLEALRTSPAQLHAFLRPMPKGADLHNHLSGAIYAESWIKWAAEDGLCIDSRFDLDACGPGATASASRAFGDPQLYRRLVDGLSMRGWRPAAVSGHDWFFDRFGHMPDLPRWRTGDALAEVRSRAAGEGVSYLELMTNPDTMLAAACRGKSWADPDPAVMRDKLLALGLRDLVANGKRDLDMVEARASEVMGCGTAGADPGCQVQTRYLWQGHRTSPPDWAFARLLMGFEMAAADPRVVGINFVAPEDDAVSMRDYRLHMRFFDYLHRVYPGVHIALHAGELAPGLVPPEGTRFHIREAIEVGHAERIGHGVDVLYEDRSADLLRDMKARNVLVEVCLTSNDVILGVRGKDHPLAAYLAAGVPVSLATDDAGLSRSDMTREWVKGVVEQGLTYRQLKAMARNSLAHSFADDLTRARLKKALEAAFDRFER